MPQRTAIEWADYSSNPLKAIDVASGKRGWHCVKVSTGCANCYAEAINRRFGTGHAYNSLATKAIKFELDEMEIARLRKFKPKGPFKNGRDRPVVFPFDMTDLFQMDVPNAIIDSFIEVVLDREDVDFMVLTKRPGRMRNYMTELYKRIDGLIENLHLGISAENQQMYEMRIEDLVRTPAAVRFLSLEPLLGPINLRLSTRLDSAVEDRPGHPLYCTRINTAIVGGESGRGSRPCVVEHVGSIVDQCDANGVNCFVKQLGSRPATQLRVAGINDDGLKYFKLADPKGGDMSQWAGVLRVRQMHGARS
jgi:protein gp37